MRPPRLILLLLCFILLPIFLTTLSLLSAHPESNDSPGQVRSRTSRLKALFSFHAPSSLFPPSAIISLTDDNSTFFLARPAAFGPLLPSNGLSAQLWIGSGFGDDSLRIGGIRTVAEGELGCSDVPGWEDAENSVKNGDGELKVSDSKARSDAEIPAARAKRELDRTSDKGKTPRRDDGTDDHLHHPLPESDANQSGGKGEVKNKPTTHADIQSLQESAEIAGKVVLLSRGGCGFLEKVKWAQRRGAVALIVGDDTRGGGLVTMYARGDTSNVTIPSVFTSYTTAHLLSSLIPPGQVVSGKPQYTLGSNKKSKSLDSKTSTKTADIPRPTATAPSAPRKPGLFRSLLSVLGVSSGNLDSGVFQEDSRRPPSSGNIDWVVVDTSDQDEAPHFSDKITKNKGKSAPPARGSFDTESQQSQEDDFIIGVHDWRDPDLVARQRSSTSAGTATSTQARSKTGPQGGSTTPGSGEYPSDEYLIRGKANWRGGRKNDASPKPDKPSGNQGGRWWSHVFGWGDEEQDDTHGDDELVSVVTATSRPAVPTQNLSLDDGGQVGHEGLWVTLTPTNMSSSPFFDTLLVLVVSPLVTLTVVYTLLLLRSRIRRRRWRAPKAIVDRLPVRTYHTMSSNSSTPSARSPDSSSASSPLLSRSNPSSSSEEARSPTVSDSLIASTNPRGHGTAEKRSSRTSARRKRYAGRQVECVVCLEEYIDGQSRVMSLPCGHEFHVECM